MALPPVPSKSAATATSLRVTLGFVGSGRKLRNRQIGELHKMVADPSVGAVHHGGCTGGDEVCHQFALYSGKNVVVHPPDEIKMQGHCTRAAWSKSQVVRLESKEFLLRIEEIVAACDVLVACPETAKEAKGSIAWYAIRRAKKLKKTVNVISPSCSGRDSDISDDE